MEDSKLVITSSSCWHVNLTESILDSYNYNLELLYFSDEKFISFLFTCFLYKFCQ